MRQKYVRLGIGARGGSPSHGFASQRVKSTCMRELSCSQSTGPQDTTDEQTACLPVSNRAVILSSEVITQF